MILNDSALNTGPLNQKVNSAPPVEVITGTVDIVITFTVNIGSSGSEIAVEEKFPIPYEDKTSVLGADVGALDFYGSGVALSKDGLVMAVGARAWDVATSDNRGCVYIFDWDGSAWVERLKIQAGDAADQDGFGSSCALNSDGSILAVGAYFWEGTSTNIGGVYVFDWNGSSFVQRGIISAPAQSTTSQYVQFGAGCALSSDGSILAVGAPGVDSTYADQGAVYVFDWVVDSWVQRAVLLASDAAATDLFGASCALSSDGSILAVGATGWEDGAVSGIGSAYIYDWSGSSWLQRSILKASDAAASDGFGSSCAFNADGSILAVGASMWELVMSNAGGLYIFQWDGYAWHETNILKAPTQDWDMYYGWACALSADGDILAVGAPGASTVYYLRTPIPSIDITLVESMLATTFIVNVYDVASKALVSTHSISGNTTIEIPDNDSVFVTLYPDIGSIWKKATPYSVSDKVFPTDPSTTPFYYECTSAGTSGVSEPSWSTSGAISDGTAVWSFVENFAKPITHGPLVPV